MLAYKYRSDKNLERDISTLIENCIYTAPFDTLNDKDEATFNNAFLGILKLIEDAFPGDTKGIRQHTDSLMSFKEVIGVYSMCKSQFNCHMWREYANEHRGFCIEYDFDKLCEEVVVPLKKDINSLEVHYQDNFPTVYFEDLRHNRELLGKLYGTKLRKWKPEEEVRILKDQFGKKQYFPSALKAIYFGKDASPQLQQKVCYALKDFDVKFYRIVTSANEKMEAVYLSENKRPIDRLDSKCFEVITRHMPAVENFYVIFKPAVGSKEEIVKFINDFKTEYATKNANIIMYDNATDKNLLYKDWKDLSDEEYSRLEAHKIAEMLFSGDEILFEKLL